MRFVFDSSDECTVVHSALYSCLRAVFGLSVAGVLVAVFSCMLVYQLLSHERKKMYWEQLELRCRSLYAGPQPPQPPPLANGNTQLSIIGTPRNRACRCCEQCHSHRSILQPGYSWDNDNRFWPPIPGSGGNFYSPNPGADEHLIATHTMPQTGMRTHRPGWSWPRLPWQRNESQRFSHTPSSPDSQYGFSNQLTRLDNTNLMQAHGAYTVINGSQHYSIWGPPPPYSDPNSPARRVRYQYNHPIQCQQIVDSTTMPEPFQQQQLQSIAVLECHQHNAITDTHGIEQVCQLQTQSSHRGKKHSAIEANDNYENTTPSDSDNQRENQSNTLPFRRAKRKVYGSAKGIGTNQSTSRGNIQNVFDSKQNMNSMHRECTGHREIPSCSNNSHYEKQITESNVGGGVENSGFQSVDENKIFEPAESEVYFADVSSCCNNSVKNDHFYDETNRINKNRVDENEEYLPQRFGKRETSVQNYDKSTSLNAHQNNATLLRSSQIQKDLSCESMCSMESGEKTDFTDLSPITPNAAYSLQYPMQDSNSQRGSNNNNKKHYQQQTKQLSPLKSTEQTSLLDTSSNFVASSPYASNEQTQEAHRRSTKNLPEILLNSDSPDEDTNRIMTPKKATVTSTVSGNQNSNNSISPYHEDLDGCSSYNEHHHHYRPHHQSLSSSSPQHPYLSANLQIQSGTSLNITPRKRQQQHQQRSSVSTSENSIIHNLSDRDIGLLYGDKRRETGFMNRDYANAVNDTNQLSPDNEWADHKNGDRRL